MTPPSIPPQPPWAKDVPTPERPGKRSLTSSDRDVLVPKHDTPPKAMQAAFPIEVDDDPTGMYLKGEITREELAHERKKRPTEERIEHSENRVDQLLELFIKERNEELAWRAARRKLFVKIGGAIATAIGLFLSGLAAGAHC